MRRAARRDANHVPLCDRFRALGCSVFETDRVGEGFPDIVVGVAGRDFLVEIKNPETHYGRGGLNPNQVAFAGAWRGGRVWVVTSLDEVSAVVANWRRAMTTEAMRLSVRGGAVPVGVGGHPGPGDSTDGGTTPCDP